MLAEALGARSPGRRDSEEDRSQGDLREARLACAATVCHMRRRSDPAQLEVEVARIEVLDLGSLRAEWARLFGPAPSLRSVEILSRLIAWRLQAEADPETVQALNDRLAGVRPQGRSGVLHPGDRVFRVWQGVRHEVLVLEDGKLAYDEAEFDSLSAVARAITGARWNGPRFFGLRQEAV